jgi:hypothetical protein
MVAPHLVAWCILLLLLLLLLWYDSSKLRGFTTLGGECCRASLAKETSGQQPAAVSLYVLQADTPHHITAQHSTA